MRRKSSSVDRLVQFVVVVGSVGLLVFSLWYLVTYVPTTY